MNDPSKWINNKCSNCFYHLLLWHSKNERQTRGRSRSKWEFIFIICRRKRYVRMGHGAFLRTLFHFISKTDCMLIHIPYQNLRARNITKVFALLESVFHSWNCIKWLKVNSEYAWWNMDWNNLKRNCVRSQYFRFQ